MAKSKNDRTPFLNLSKPYDGKLDPKDPKEFICTLNILHTLESDDFAPAWFNNGLLIEKHKHDREFIVVDGWVGAGGKWHGEGTAPFVAVRRVEGAEWCVFPKPGDKIHRKEDDKYQISQMIADMVKIAKKWDNNALEAEVIKLRENKHLHGDIEQGLRDFEMAGKDKEDK